jgi:pyrroline-5-carboxylate reductase
MGTRTLLVVGGGNMAEALLGGILASESSGLGAGDVLVVEPSDSRRAFLATRFPGVGLASSVAEAVSGGAVAASATGGRGVADVLIAVKPNHVEEVCVSVRELLSGGRVLSIAAGITIGQLEGWLGADLAVVRSMPNTPSLVGVGAAGLAGGASASVDDVAWAKGLLECVGVAVEVPESKLDAVTGLSGSGPAYVFLVAEALIDAGVLVGLPRDVAETLAKQTLLGAATLLSASSEDAATLRGNVTSPGGTTAAGLRALENRSVRAAFIDAVSAATDRAAELRNG